MVGHETIGINQTTVFFLGLLQYVQKENVVGLREKNLLLIVSPLENMEGHSGYAQTRPSRHKKLLSFRLSVLIDAEKE
jgi:hypothetical protein